jgi:hypothetical protein
MEDEKWHGRGRRFDPDQVHQIPQQVRLGEYLRAELSVYMGRFGLSSSDRYLNLIIEIASQMPGPVSGSILDTD